MLGGYRFGLMIDIPVLATFAQATIGTGTYTFGRMKL